MMESPRIRISNSLFVSNGAAAASTTLGSSIPLSAYMCGDGCGGAVCLVGSPGSVIMVQNATFLNNSASFGGAVSLHSDSSCTLQQLSTGCFSAHIESTCNFTNNTAIDGAGGAVFWTHSGNLNVTCSSLQDTDVLDGAGSSKTADLFLATACSDWLGNQVTGTGYGPIIASTPFSLIPLTRVFPYYTSNELLPLTLYAQVRPAISLCKVVITPCLLLLEPLQTSLVCFHYICRFINLS